MKKYYLLLSAICCAFALNYALLHADSFLYFTPATSPKPQSVSAETLASHSATERLVVKPENKLQKVETSSVTASPDKLFQNAKMLRNCLKVPKNKTQLEQWVERATSSGEPFAYINDIQNRFESCQSVSRENPDYIHQLIVAAKQGSDGAASELWAIGDNELVKYINSQALGKIETELNSKELEQFAATKYQLARENALKGGAQSLRRLVLGYQNFDPETNQPNLLKASAFARFGMQTTNDNDLYRFLSWVQERIAPKLNELQQNQSDSYLKQLLQSAGD